MTIAGAKKILIIRLSSLGDILLSTPLIRSIKKKIPDSEIDFVLRENYADLLKFNPYIRKVYEYHESRFVVQSIINSIIPEKYDLIIDLQNNMRSAEITNIVHVPCTKYKKYHLEKFLLVKFKLNRMKKLPPIPVRYKVSIEDLQLDDEGLDLFTDNIPSAELQSKNNLVGICPGAKHFTKRWPAEFYIGLIKKLQANNFNAVLFGGILDSEICAKIEVETGAINLCNDDNILQTAADMKLCKFIYANDSGLMHVAAAVKVPLIAFFGSTVKEFGFFPYNTKSAVIENNNLSCRPCTHIGKNHCPKKHFKCMKELTPEIAYDKLKEFNTN